MKLTGGQLWIKAGWGGTHRLTGLVGWRNARELFLTGLQFDEKEKEAQVLIHKFVPTKLLDDETEKLCDRLKRGAPFI